MSTRWGYFCQHLLLAAAAATMTACGSGGGGSDNTDTTNTETIAVVLNGDNRVPPVTNTGQGSGMVTVDYDSGEITGSVTVSGLTGAVTNAHIHTAFAGIEGPVYIGMAPSAGDPNTWEIPDGSMLDASHLQALRDGGLYINFHTAANPTGEVRGQLEPSNVTVVRTTLDGTQEPPSGTGSAATGIGYLTFNSTTRNLVANVRTEGIVGIAAHIHDAPAGTNGPVQVGLTQDATDANLWATDAGATLNAAQIASLAINYLYFNVHSNAFPDGEIRGQIVVP